MRVNVFSPPQGIKNYTDYRSNLSLSLSFSIALCYLLQKLTSPDIPRITCIDMDLIGAAEKEQILLVKIEPKTELYVDLKIGLKIPDYGSNVNKISQ